MHDDGEHIYIDGDGSDDAVAPRTVTECLHICNRAHGVTTELVFYDEGYVRARKDHRGKTALEVLVDLKFLDPNYRRQRRRAGRWLWSSAAAAAISTIVHLLPTSVIPQPWGTMLTAIAATAAFCAALMFVYRTEERLEFCTPHGRAAVLRLSASFGCLRRFRRAADAVAEAARAHADTQERDSERYLRAEMRAHYALRERGVISERVRADSTARILAAFG